jgi:hypothetical protein
LTVLHLIPKAIETLIGLRYAVNEADFGPKVGLPTKLQIIPNDSSSDRIIHGIPVAL